MNWLPLQTNLLPFWFFPWNTPSWPGFTPFVAHKELLAVDALRQIFIWKEYAFSLLRQGTWPLWNPYNFSGQPLLANFQSSVFYPLSWGFLFLPAIAAWSIYIFSQPVLAGIFMFWFLKNKLQSKTAALFGALTLIFCAFFATRYFWGVYLHPLIWLPLELLVVDKFADTKIGGLKFIAFLSPLLVLNVLGGYPQDAVFGFLIAGSYFLFRAGIKRMLPLTAAVLLTLMVCAVQLLPTAELYQNSLREGKATNDAYNGSIVEWKHLVQIISPDFWGSPATNNYEGGQDYSGVNAYFGVIPLIFAVYALFSLRKQKEIAFWAAVAAAGLLLSFRNPIAYLPRFLRIPILSSGGPWNSLFLFQFAAAVLAGWGLNKVLPKNPRRVLPITLIILAAALGLLFFGRQSSTAVRNTLLQLAWLLLFIFSLLLPRKLFSGAVLLLLLVSGGIFLLKVSPFGDSKYFYPRHPLLGFVQNYGGYNRVFGYGSSRFATNFATFYRIYSPEGYDSLSPRWYGQLIASAETGTIPEKVNRADIFLTEADTPYRRKLLNLLGVKYFFDRAENPQETDKPNLLKYPPEQFNFLKHWGEAAVYENREALPRVFLAENYLVRRKEETIRTFYAGATDLSKTVILNEPLSGVIGPGTAEITNYTPGKVSIKTDSPGRSLLFLSDTYYPGWKATVGGKATKILLADYAFRAVSVPPGQNEVVFSYEPDSFRYGLWLSTVGLAVTLCLFLKILLSSTGRFFF